MNPIFRLFAALSMLMLAACTSSNFNDGVAPARTVSSNTSSGPVPAGEVVGQPPIQTSETALANTGSDSPSVAAVNQLGAADPNRPASEPKNKVSFLPVTGAPQRTVSSLSAALKSQSDGLSVALVPSTDPGAKYRVKGYFSAIDDGSGSLVVYVWDVLNQSGKRVYRISGQQRAGAAGGDPWNSVTQPVVKEVARDTLVRLETWLDRS